MVTILCSKSQQCQQYAENKKREIKKWLEKVNSRDVVTGDKDKQRKIKDYLDKNGICYSSSQNANEQTYRIHALSQNDLDKFITELHESLKRLSNSRISRNIGEKDQTYQTSETRDGSEQHEMTVEAQKGDSPQIKNMTNPTNQSNSDPELHSKKANKFAMSLPDNRQTTKTVTAKISSQTLREPRKKMNGSQNVRNQSAENSKENKTQTNEHDQKRNTTEKEGTVKSQSKELKERVSLTEPKADDEASGIPSDNTKIHLPDQSEMPVAYTTKESKERISIIEPTANEASAVPGNNPRIHLPGSSAVPTPNSEKEDIKNMFRLKNGLLVKVYKAEISTLQVGAIVNPANDKLINCGGAAEEISKAAGKDFDKECKRIIEKIKTIPVTKNEVTGSGNLPCGKVINAVGPRWNDYTDDKKFQCLDDLSKTVSNILETGNREQIQDVAMPPISSGIFGVPANMCAFMYVKGIIEYDKKNRKLPKEIHIVDQKDTTLDRTIDAYEQWQKDKKCVDPKGVLQRCSQDETKDVKKETANTAFCVFQHEENGKLLMKMGENLKVWIYIADIVKLDKISVLVSAENGMLSGSGALAQSIRRFAGKEYCQIHDDLQAELRRTGCKLNPGDYRVTQSGKLKYRFVIHSVTERFSEERPPEEVTLAQLKRTTSRLLNHVNELALSNPKKKTDKVKSIAMPLLGSGALTYQPYIEMFCNAVYRAIEDFAKRPDAVLQEIHLVSFSDITNDAFKCVFMQRSKGSKFLKAPPTMKPQRPTSGLYMPEHTLSDSNPVEKWTMPQERGISTDFNRYYESWKPKDHGSVSNEETCVICMDAFCDAVELSKCHHKFCRDCITGFFLRRSVCPVCNVVYGTIYGDQPRSGTACVYKDKDPLPGFPKQKTWVIVYEFPNGIQKEHHPSPGMPFKGIRRAAYLPADKEGTEVLHLLEKAFKQGLVFTIGSSRTTGRDNVVTWNDIHHKTNRTGGPQRFGYPDPNYLARIRDELKAKGITQ